MTSRKPKGFGKHSRNPNQSFGAHHEDEGSSDEVSLNQKLKELGNSSSPLVPSDVIFTFENDVDDGAGVLRVGAHKYILALGSEVFRSQFYGRLKESKKEIEIVDSSHEMFKLFIKMFYEDVDISGLNISCLSELYYLGDKYDVKELRDEVLVTLTGKADTDDDPLLAVEAAVLGHSNNILPELSEALFQKSVKILMANGSANRGVVSMLFRDMGPSYTTGDDIVEDVLSSILSKLELASLCPNCHRPPAQCLDKAYLNIDNFVEGAQVKLSHIRFCLPDSRAPVTIGNPAVYKLGAMLEDGMFSSFSETGLPLQLSKLYSGTYTYNCSEKL